jgi:hypothetical protein
MAAGKNRDIAAIEKTLEAAFRLLKDLREEGVRAGLVDQGL